jgi:hypothetical protein
MLFPLILGNLKIHEVGVGSNDETSRQSSVEIGIFAEKMKRMTQEQTQRYNSMHRQHGDHISLLCFLVKVKVAKNNYTNFFIKNRHNTTINEICL